MTQEQLMIANDLWYTICDAKKSKDSDMKKLELQLRSVFPDPNIFDLIKDDVDGFMINVSVKLNKLIEEKQKEFDSL